MPYLLQHLRRPLAPPVRVDEKIRLNLPGLYGDAYVRVHVGDSTKTRREPRIELEIADCTNEIVLEFGLWDERFRENSLFKIDTLLGSLHRFRDALAEEARLAAQR